MKDDISPIVGEDGRLYFHYRRGQSYVNTRRKRVLNCVITDCVYKNEHEYYSITLCGQEMACLYSLNQLGLLLEGWQTIEEGERVEIPLLTDEVVAYYGELNRENRIENVRANAQLKGTTYNSLLTSISDLQKRIDFAKASENAETLPELESELAKKRQEMEKILTAAKVDEAVLKKTYRCEKCFDNGLIDGKICDCAMERAEGIKRYNAFLRLRK